MKCRRRRAHHDRADLEKDLIRKRERVSAGDLDELRISSVAMFSDHLYRTAKLFQTPNAELTGAAVGQIVHADTIARPDMFDIGTDFFDPTGDFVSERYRQMIEPRNPRAIMFIGMTDPAGGNPNQNIGRTDLRKGNLRFFKRLADRSQSHRAHAFNESAHPGLSSLTRLCGNAFGSARAA